ncbi:DNA primase [uncultured Candidatus Thioglobus sp.]|nr:DNA primase [uncultured Candidatus Thioglobus sp.]
MGTSIQRKFTDELLLRVDIVGIIENALTLKKSGQNFTACCPFHEEKTPSFTVSQAKQFYYCFGCGAHGTAISFLMDYHSMRFVEAVEELAVHAGMEIPQNIGGTNKTRGSAELYSLMELATQHFCKQIQTPSIPAQLTNYFAQRGLSADIIKEFEIGFSASNWTSLLDALATSDEVRKQLLRVGMIVKRDSGGYYDRFRARIMFPIRDQRGRVVGFGGRVLDDSKPKYLNSPETDIFQKRLELYGLFQARKHIQDMGCAYIVEGYMDVLALIQHGVKHVVAVLGTAITAEHLKKIFRICPKIIFCFDGDNAGKEAAWRAMEIALPLLQEGRQGFFMFMPDGADPDSYIQKYGREKFVDAQQHVPLSDYMIEKFKRGSRLDSREDMSKLVEGILPLIAKLPVGALRTLILRDIAQLADMTLSSLEDLLGKKQFVSKKLLLQNQVTRTMFDKSGNILVTDAVCVLLHNPALAMQVELNVLDGVTLQGVDFLQELLVLIYQNPKISCAGILEHWRDSKYEKRLKELSIKDNVFAELDNPHEFFLEIIAKIKQNYERQLRNKCLHEIQSTEDLRVLFPPVSAIYTQGEND